MTDFKTKLCMECGEKVRTYDSSLSFLQSRHWECNIVTLTRQQYQWDGPVATAIQWFYIGECSRCHHVHFLPDTARQVDGGAHIRMHDQEYLRSLLNKQPEKVI